MGMDGVELILVVAAMVGVVSPLYYKVGKMEVKLNQICKNIKVTMEWKNGGKRVKRR